MKILLVEDDPRVGLVLRTCLEKWKHEVEIVLNGEDAWQALQHRDIALLITDWALPGMTGTELVQHVRLEGQVQDLPVLMISGRAEKKDISAALKVGVNSYLPKPFTPAQLKTKIESACHPLNRLPTRKAIARVVKGVASTGGQNDPLILLGESSDQIEELFKADKRGLAKYLIWMKKAVDEANSSRPDFGLGYMLDTSTQAIATRFTSASFRQRVQLVLVATDCRGDTYSLIRSIKRNEANQCTIVAISNENGFPKQVQNEFSPMGVHLLTRRDLVPDVIESMIEKHILHQASM